MRWGKAVTYIAVLIGGYIAVTNFKGFSTDEAAAATGGANFVKTLQGR